MKSLNGPNPLPGLLPVPSEPGALVGEPFINKREVARRLGRTIRGVNLLMRRKIIPFYKFDERPAFRWSEIQSHLAQTCRTLRSATTPTKH